MPVINGKTLLAKSPIRGMASRKLKAHGTSYGLGEAGYDIRIKQEIHFRKDRFDHYIRRVDSDGNVVRVSTGRFTLASAIEEFDMPRKKSAIMRNCWNGSSWAGYRWLGTPIVSTGKGPSLSRLMRR